VFEKGVLKRIFRPKGEELASGWRRLLHNLQSSSNVIAVIKSRNKIGKECIMHENDEKCIQNFGQKT
jgi:hypothetical protein